jgi:hypothetical protein
VNHPHINGMQGQGFKFPQLHHHLPAETARPATPAAGPTPEKTPIRRDHSPASLLPGDSRSWASGSRLEARNPCRWACARALPTRFERHRPLDRRYGPRADYPIAGAWAARACGIAVTWVGRPAPIFTLVVARPGAARGYGALVTALLWSCSGSCSSSSWVSHGRALPGQRWRSRLMTLPWWGDRRWPQPWYRVLVTAAPKSADGSAALFPGGGRPQESIGGSLGGGQSPKLWAGRVERFPCAYVDRWHP